MRVNCLDKKIVGFTLTEVLIVTSIIILLTVIVMSYFRSQIFKGNDARRKADIHKIQLAMEEYEKDHNCYPGIELVRCTPGTGLNPYLEKIPCDPVTKESYAVDYDRESCPSWYRIYTKLENSNDNDTSKLNCVYGCGPSLVYNFYARSPNAPDPAFGTSTPAGSAVATFVPAPGRNYYGCKNEICVPVGWDPERQGPVCEPTYQNANCYGQCNTPGFECTNWK